MDTGRCKRLDKMWRLRLFDQCEQEEMEFHFEPEHRQKGERLDDETKSRLRSRLAYLSSDDNSLITESLDTIDEILIKNPHEVLNTRLINASTAIRVADLINVPECASHAMALLLDLLTNTSGFDAALVDHRPIYKDLECVIRNCPEAEVVCLAFNLCTLLLRYSSFRPRAFESGIYRTIREILERELHEDVSLAIATFLLKSASKTGGVPQFFSCLLSCVPLLLRGSHATLDAGLALLAKLMNLTEEAESCLEHILQSQDMMYILADNLASIEDIEVLRVLARAPTFGDKHIQILVERDVLTRVINGIYDKCNEKVMAIVLQLISNWATHTKKYHETIFRFALQIDFPYLVSQSSHGLKEMTVHAFRILVALSPATVVFEFVTEQLFDAVMETMLACDYESDMCYEICVALGILLQKSEHHPQASAEIRKTLNRPEVLTILENLNQQCIPDYIRTHAHFIISSLNDSTLRQQQAPHVEQAFGENVNVNGC